MRGYAPIKGLSTGEHKRWEMEFSDTRSWCGERSWYDRSSRPDPSQRFLLHTGGEAKDDLRII